MDFRGRFRQIDRDKRAVQPTRAMMLYCDAVTASSPGFFIAISRHFILRVSTGFVYNESESIDLSPVIESAT